MSSQKEMSEQDAKRRINSGFEGANIPTDFTIPIVGIKDVDGAMFDLFDKDNQIYVATREEDGHELTQKKVPVVFATGERFALRERHNPIRDKNGALILPIISVRRTGLSQAKENMGSAIGQDTGDFVIKKRLSPKDPQYQNIINKLGLKNQDNLPSDNNFLNSVSETGNQDGKVASRRDRFVRDNNRLFEPDLGRNIFEIITIPFPIRYVATYDVTIWTSYQSHMNSIIERIMTNYDGQGRTYKLSIEKGYYFVAYFEDDIQTEDNSEDFTNDERVHKYTFRVSVPAYLVANKNGGDSIPLRKFYSAPQLSFGIYDGFFSEKAERITPSGDPNDFILNNINNLDSKANEIKRLNDLFQQQIMQDPFSGKEETKFVRIKRRNARHGETTISSKKLTDIEIP